VVEIARDDVPSWLSWTSLVLAAIAILTALIRTVPSAVRLGRRSDPAAAQSALARSIWRDHVLCLAAIGSLVVLQLAFG